MKEYCCPVCKRRDNGRVFLKATYEFHGVDDLDFSARPIPNHAYFTFMRCRECDSLYVEKALTFDELEAIYTASSFNEKSEGCQASETYAKYVKKKIPDIHGKAMDIGASEGSFLLELLKLGYEDVSGVEPTLEAVNKADPLVKDKIKQEMFKAENFPEDTYDLISFFQVIEHVSDPEEVLTGIRRLLKDDGRIIIVCHNYKSLINKIMGRRSPIYCLGHLQIFSPKSVRKLMEKIGYHDVDVFKVTNRYELNYWIKMSPLPSWLKNPILRFVKFIRIGGLKISIVGSNMGVVARK